MNVPHDDWIRPYGLIINGVLERGLELAIVNGTIQEIRASSHPCESFIVSSAFVNAHSHLEYRGMQEAIDKPMFFEWIFELARLKALESPEYVREQCDLAAAENKRTGVAWIGEHSDRDGSAEAMIKHGIGGWIFHEVITLSENETPRERLEHVACRLEATRKVFPDSSLNPHAYYTVDEDILKMMGKMSDPSSIHVAETTHESNFVRLGKGKFADRRRSQGISFNVYNLSIVEVLRDHGVLHRGVQCVHCCDVDEFDIQILAKTGVTIAHCPQSNQRLQCPHAPVREFLDAGITVGLGLDSPASGGPINMFAEMREAMAVAAKREKPLTGDEVWRMATCDGYQSFGKPGPDAWDIYEGSSTPLIRIHVDGVKSVEELIEIGNPSKVSWI
ncbi:MAG: amidohydrolase family protein [Armatimonadota bacterium]